MKHHFRCLSHRFLMVASPIIIIPNPLKHHSLLVKVPLTYHLFKPNLFVRGHGLPAPDLTMSWCGG